MKACSSCLGEAICPNIHPCDIGGKDHDANAPEPNRGGASFSMVDRGRSAGAGGAACQHRIHCNPWRILEVPTEVQWHVALSCTEPCGAGRHLLGRLSRWVAQ